MSRRLRNAGVWEITCKHPELQGGGVPENGTSLLTAAVARDIVRPALLGASLFVCTRQGI